MVPGAEKVFVRSDTFEVVSVDASLASDFDASGFVGLSSSIAITSASSLSISSGLGVGVSIKPSSAIGVRSDSKLW